MDEQIRGTVFALAFAALIIGLSWWRLSRTTPEPRNSYESFKQDASRTAAKVWLLLGIGATFYGISELLKSPEKPAVRKVIRHRKPIAKPKTDTGEVSDGQDGNQTGQTNQSGKEDAK